MADMALSIVELPLDLALLDGPQLDAMPLALLAAGERLACIGEDAGFLHVRDAAGREGFVPGAPFQVDRAALATPKMVHVSQVVRLYRNPQPGRQFDAATLIMPNEPLVILGLAGKFAQIKRNDGQTGYIPANLFRRTSRGVWNQVSQPVTLYSRPEPGAQIRERWLVDPAEPLLVLGRENRFILVQRDDGSLGFVPATLCTRRAESDAIFQVGPIDLGWMFLGGSWGMINWYGVIQLVSFADLVPWGLRGYAGLALVLALAATFWLGSRRRLLARSFAIGVLLAYALLHWASHGSVTLFN